jgi:hypothetical protein
MFQHSQKSSISNTALSKNILLSLSIQGTQPLKQYKVTGWRSCRSCHECTVKLVFCAEQSKIIFLSAENRLLPIEGRKWKAYLQPKHYLPLKWVDYYGLNKFF